MTVNALEIDTILKAAWYAASANSADKSRHEGPPAFETLGAHSSYRGYFNSCSEEQTREIGAAVAALCAEIRKKISPRERARVGIMGGVGVGKTPFSDSFIRALGNARLLKHFEIMTHVSTDQGIVMHCDAGHGAKSLQGLPLRLEAAGIDMLEYPHMAVETHLITEFDVIAHIARDPLTENRLITILADDEIADTEAFAAFRASLEHLEAAP